MARLEEYSHLGELNGVSQYILVTNDGRVTAHDLEFMPSSTAAQIVLQCGKNCDKVGKPRFEYLNLTLLNDEQFFIFPIGNAYLGVLKDNKVTETTLTDNVIQFFKTLKKAT